MSLPGSLQFVDVQFAPCCKSEFYEECTETQNMLTVTADQLKLMWTSIVLLSTKR